eukprot:TRINITY_DN7260_c0_g1_i1.p1 TRINITY_DN7260_c0_g1~~TRINITY_DN7260_c0_g1_i1.p1  ORF type:complete len:205 (-),score=21.08 TRINITY_DN7260_c0_g1_i1:22-636(-)
MCIRDRSTGPAANKNGCATATRATHRSGNNLASRRSRRGCCNWICALPVRSHMPVVITAGPAAEWVPDAAWVQESDVLCLFGISACKYVELTRSLPGEYHGVHFNAVFPEWTHYEEQPSELHRRHQAHGLSIFSSSRQLCSVNQSTGTFRETLEFNGNLGRSTMLDERGLISCQLSSEAVSYTHLRAHETVLDLVCRLLLEKKK